jgi:hypothetical protein
MRTLAAARGPAQSLIPRFAGPGPICRESGPPVPISGYLDRAPPAVPPQFASARPRGVSALPLAPGFQLLVEGLKFDSDWRSPSRFERKEDEGASGESAAAFEAVTKAVQHAG